MKNLRTISMNDIRDISRGYFFNPTTMRVFRSQLAKQGYVAADGTIYFATSEQHGDEPRMGSVRFLDPKTGNIQTVGEYNSYHSMREANLEARRLATGGTL
jgi:hypothetical protein